MRGFFSVCVVVCLLAISIGAAFAFDAAAVGDALYRAVKAGEPFSLPELTSEDRTEANAYRVQAVLMEKLMTDNGDSIAGYKAGVTAPAQMQRFGATGPASAPLFKSGLLVVTDPAAPVRIKPFKGIMLETEFAFKTAKAITAPVKDEAELKGLIASIHPAIEIPQVYFADMSRVGFFDLTAAGIGSKMFLVGLPQPVDSDIDTMQVVLKHNGAAINEGKGSDALGGQWKALLWLVNNTLAQGQKIEADRYFMTGALGKMLPAAPGEYKAEYPFGTLLFTVEAP